MLDYLVNHARENVWCTPDQDLQRIFKPARITPINGVRNKFKLMWAQYALPTSNERYHVYQIGQNHPALLGLTNDREIWQRLSDVCNAKNVIVDGYTASGLHLPLFDSWLWVGPEKTILVAIRLNERLPNLNDDPYYFRIYKNAYFNSERAGGDDCIKVNGTVISELNDQLLLQREVNDLMLLKGHVYCYVNGRVVENITPVNAGVGDLVEYVYDSTIKAVVDIPIAELKSFNSEIDSKRKYLVHNPNNGDVTIDYKDDIDTWIIEKQDVGFVGCYYHKNATDSFRQLTHRDYSLGVDYLNAHVDSFEGWNDPLRLHVRLHVREAGYLRPLTMEHNRIHELYKLSDKDIVDAMLGIDSNVSVWRAEVLEASDYTKVMSDLDWIVDAEAAVRMYGYNSATKLVGDAFHSVIDSGQWRYVDIPTLYQERCTAYEYDQTGSYLSHHLVTDDRRYDVRNGTAAFVEFIYGHGTMDQGTVFGETRITVDARHTVRCYTCPIVEGSPSYEWTDVTGTNQYVLAGNEVIWDIDPIKTYTAVRTDAKHLVYRPEMHRDDNLLKFTINSTEPYSGTDYTKAALIPPAKLDIWLNNRILIENLDYYVSWPEVVICGKKHMVTGSPDILVRAYGHCNSNLERESVGDFGFVQHGYLSRNKRFDIRDDRVMRFHVGGSMCSREAMVFSEDNPTVSIEGVANGTPYAIDDYLVPLKEVDPFKTYELRGVSREIDAEISDYLTHHLPEAEEVNPNIIPERYEVVSPIVAKLIDDMHDDVIGYEDISGHYGSDKVRDMLEPYMYLLDYDPALKGVDSRYVRVVPHGFDGVIELNIYQYTFIERVINLILEGRVDLSNHIRIGALTDD